MEKKDKMPHIKSVKLNHIFPEDLKSNFVSNMIIQFRPDHFVLSFFEIWPPPVVGETKEEKDSIINKIEHIDAKCVSRLVITPEKMHDFIRAMSENLREYEKMMENEINFTKE
jgi:hypothetical protein